MPKKALLSADTEIICPKCDHKFPLHGGIGKQFIERHEQEFLDELKKQEEKVFLEASTKEREQVNKKFARKIEELEEHLAGKSSAW